MISIERTFKFVNYYENGKNFDKAEIIMNALEKHIKSQLKANKRLFDQFMEMGLEDLQDIFKER